MLTGIEPSTLWTDAMIALPYPVTRICLRSFWSLICLFAGVLIGVLWPLPLSVGSFGLGIILALTLALPGLLWPFLVSVPYRVWNKLAREFARWTRPLIIGICYVIFIAVGRMGTSLRLAPPTSTESRWVTRRTLAPATYVSQYSVPLKESSQKWIPTFLSWAVHSGNLWACCLLPFLVLLSVVKTDQEDIFPADIYTLF